MKPLFLLLLMSVLLGCGSYKQNIMFKVEDVNSVKQVATQADKSYTLQNHDVVSFKVYTKNGERIIDPDAKLLSTNQSSQGSTLQKEETFEIDENGIARLPMLGDIKLQGLTLHQTEQLLQKEFLKYYENVFVTLTCTSRRVIVLGAPGGQVIPLTHENTSLVEVIALSKGPTAEGKVGSIRVLRGEEVFLIDFSTISGYQKGNMIVQPGDVVYIEPVRKPVVEALRDFIPFISVLSAVTVIIALTK